MRSTKDADRVALLRAEARGWRRIAEWLARRDTWGPYICWRIDDASYASAGEIDSGIPKEVRRLMKRRLRPHLPYSPVSGRPDAFYVEYYDDAPADWKQGPRILFALLLELECRDEAHSLRSPKPQKANHV